MNFNDAMVFLNTKGNAILVFITLTINFWGFAYFIFKFKERRELRIKMAEENLVKQLQDGIKDLKEKLEEEKKLTVNFWLEKSKEGLSLDGLPQEYNLQKLQEAGLYIIPPIYDYFLQLGKLRAEMFWITENEIELQEAVRLVRVASLVKPHDKKSMDELNELVEILASYKFIEGQYNPDDPLLNDSSFDHPEGIALDKENLVNFLLSKGEEALKIGFLSKSERIFNRARHIAINNFGKLTELAFEARYCHLSSAFECGLVFFCEREIDVLLEDCAIGLNDDHPLTLNIRYLRIRILDHLGQYQEALAALDELLPVEERVRGKEHPSTLATRSLRIQILDHLGQYQEALVALDEQLPVEERVRGKEHPDTLVIRSLRIKILDHLGQHQEALVALDELLPVEERVRGKEHPDTLVTRSLRIQILDHLGQYQEALVALDEQLPVEERVRGKEHPDTLVIRSLRIKILDHLGQHQEALVALDELLPVEERVRGKEHPDTLATRSLRIQILDHLGQHQEALAALDELLPVEERVKGKEHPDTLATRSLRIRMLSKR